MNKLTIIGNLTRDPELRTTQAGKEVCSFTVAVNKPRRQNNQNDADFFRVTAWEEKGKLCAQYLAKGKKVCVVGPVSVSTFTGNDGTTKAQMEVKLDEIEFLTPRDVDRESGMQRVNPAGNPFVQDELPV